MKKKEKSKSAHLQAILAKLSKKGGFEACFLIDGQGMPVARITELDSPESLNVNTVGALFSLIDNSLSRTIDGLDLQKLDYFKFASGNAIFMLKHINIEDYERDFILLTYHQSPVLGKGNSENKGFFHKLTSLLKFWEPLGSRLGQNSEKRQIKLMDGAASQIKELFEE